MGACPTFSFRTAKAMRFNCHVSIIHPVVNIDPRPLLSIKKVQTKRQTVNEFNWLPLGCAERLHVMIDAVD
jgi:hypothetical protein